MHITANDAQRSDDAALVGRMARGDEGALRQFYQRHSRGIYALCLRIVGNPSDAEDVLVDVFYEYFRRISGYDESRGSPIGLLVTLARSRSIDRRRSRSRLRASTLDEPSTIGQASMIDEAPRPDQQASANQQQQIVRRALQSLQPEYRQCIERAYYDGMSHSEIAVALGKPLGTVKTYIRQGLLRLRDSLGQVESNKQPST
jgi:RNA polymerase sigma-70 factor (ECF subfamily)